MKREIQVGKTSKRLRIFVLDSSQTDGRGLTGLAFNSSGLTWYFSRDDDGNAGGTAVSVVTATRGTFTSGGFVEKDATHMPGVYEIGIPNAALAVGSTGVEMVLKGVTNMAPVTLEIQLTAYDPDTALATASSLASLQTTANTITTDVVSLGSPMQAYTQPTNFLTTTFPSGTVANTTNITAGTITTVTNLTNAPTAGDLTATMKTSVTTAATAATPTASIAAGAISDASFTLPTLTAPATGAVGMIRQLWNRFFQKSVYDSGSNFIKTYASDNTTVVTTQTTSDSAGVQTAGKAS